MSRFSEPQDPAFRALNASIGFDRRLWPFDVAQSRAHARMLAARGIIEAADRDALLAGLDEVERELAEERFPFAPDDEDIHMAIERRLTEVAGPVGGRLHTARSRNDQVATDVSLFTREAAGVAVTRVDALVRALLGAAERHLDWAMPGYTHLQRAQPVYLSHHLLAYAWMLLRDRERFRAAIAAANVMPLGAGALAGVNFDTDREMVARDLGFAAVAPNSIDAVANRDFVLDYLHAAATTATHLSRLGAELVLWSSEEFGFVVLPDAWTSGSSIMPQKKNPDAAELLRAKAPRVVGHLAALHGVLHALPLTYNKDMQEDKEHLFDAVDTLELSLAAATGMVERRALRPRAPGGRRRRRADRRHRPRRPARQARHALPRGPRRRRRARARGGGQRAPARGARGRRRSAPAPRRSLRAARGWSRRSARAGRRWLASASSWRPPVWRSMAESPERLGEAFFDRPVLAVARDLVGCRVEHAGAAGIVVETEAYHFTEPACHAYVGLTDRTSTIYGPPGVAYVYRSYGIHALLNAVCEPEGVGAAVLIRALEPVDGLDLMRARRGLQREEDLCSGPGKLTQALGIDLRHNGSSLLDGPVVDRPAPGRPAAPADRRGRAHRHHEGGRAAVALLRAGQPQRLPAVAARAARVARAPRRLTAAGATRGGAPVPPASGGRRGRRRGRGGRRRSRARAQASTRRHRRPTRVPRRPTRHSPPDPPEPPPEPEPPEPDPSGAAAPPETGGSPSSGTGAPGLTGWAGAAGPTSSSSSSGGRPFCSRSRATRSSRIWSAVCMKSCQMSAGNVPPSTGSPANSVSIGRSLSG